MTLIERYICKNIASLLIAILSITIAIAWTIEALGKINFVTTNGQGFLAFMYLSMLFIPSVMVTVIPFALTITIAQTLHRLNQNSEMVIIVNASGSRLYIWRPIVIIGLIFSIALFFIANFLVPLARRDMRTIIASANANFLNNFIQEDNFIELQKNLFIKTGKHIQSGDINRILIADERGQSINHYYYATSGHIVQQENSTLLMMSNGQLTKRNKLNGETSLINFSTYNFDLGTLLPAGSKSYLYPKDQYLSALLAYPKQASDYKTYAAELHYRLTSWLYPLIFTIITLLINANPVTYREAKQNSPLIFTAILALSIYLLCYFCKTKAQTNQSYIIGLYLIPPIILFAGQIIFSHAKNSPKRLNIAKL